MRIFHASLIFSLTVSLIFLPIRRALAFGGGDNQCTSCQAKYVLGVKPLGGIEVKLFGAVGKAGLHYVPSDTDLVTLLAGSGAPTSNAEGTIIIKRIRDAKETRETSNARETREARGGRERTERVEIIELQLKDILESDSLAGLTKLKNNDQITVAAREPWISDNAVRLISVTAALMGLFLTSYLVIDRIRN